MNIQTSESVKKKVKKKERKKDCICASISLFGSHAGESNGISGEVREICIYTTQFEGEKKKILILISVTYT